MTSDTDDVDDRDLLELLTEYTSKWSELLDADKPSAAKVTKSILKSVTAEQNSAIRVALSKIDEKLNVQHANAAEQTVIGAVAQPRPADNDNSDTEAIPGKQRPPVEESEDVGATLIGGTEIQSEDDATFLGPINDAGESALHDTWITPAAHDGTEIPAAVGNYDIHSVLGRGGMGIVYRARQKGLKRDVALKMILSGGHANPELLSRFRAEAEAVAKLQHPNIVQIFDIGEQDGLPYFSLEFVEGQTLDEFRKGEPVDEKEAARLMEIIARAMHFAHNAGIVHRDLKPANILLTKDGDPKITDFGLVKRIEADEDIQSQTQAGSIMGTPHYMAPEQAWGHTDVAQPADVWAMGAMLYALLTGRPPFAGSSTMDTLTMLKDKEPVTPKELVPKLGTDLETICLKCLQKDKQKRYGTAEELADDLQRYLGGLPILARPISRTERLWRWCKRNPVIATSLATVATVLIAATAFSTAAAKSEAIARKDAEEKRIYAEEKEKEANDNALLAVANEKKALQQRTVALGAFNTAVEWAGTDLKNVPGTQPFKKRLFGAAVEGLNRLSEIAGDDRRDLAIARGYAKAGDGFLEVGQAKDAKAQYEVSHEIIERLAKNEPDTADQIHFLRLGRSFRNLGRAEMSLSGPKEALEWHKKAAAVREKALPLHDDPLFVKREIAESLADLGRAYLELGNAADAETVLAKCVEYRQQQLKVTPDDTNAIKDNAGLLRQLGHLQLGLGRVDQAICSHESAVTMLEPLTQRESASSIDKMNLALFRSDLADAQLIGDQNENAIGNYLLAAEAIRGVLEKNPKYVTGKKFLAGAMYGMSVAESRLNKPTATERLNECITLRREICVEAPSNKEFQRALMQALARAGESREALSIAEAQLQEFPDDGGVLYQIACAFALLAGADDASEDASSENADRAIATLQLAIDNGHEGLALMAIDPDLASLRDLADFKSLLAGADADPADDVDDPMP